SLGTDPPLARPCCHSRFYDWWHRLKLMAHVFSDGALQQIRRSGATEVARVNREMATRYLGHTTAQADKFYLDLQRIHIETVAPSPLPNAPLPFHMRTEEAQRNLNREGGAV
ncbi:MAG TPA: hypothetical protein VG713_06370, partial [Pirellulales bacterium]|nr:hypothetical protein [Pirellulales bacterium]